MPDYAPAAGKLAAAMATISARRRPIRDGATRSNERNCRIFSGSFRAGDRWTARALMEGWDRPQGVSRLPEK
jgi:hypothetical protein